MHFQQTEVRKAHFCRRFEISRQNVSRQKTRLLACKTLRQCHSTLETSLCH